LGYKDNAVQSFFRDNLDGYVGDYNILRLYDNAGVDRILFGAGMPTQTSPNSDGGVFFDAANYYYNNAYCSDSDGGGDDDSDPSDPVDPETPDPNSVFRFWSNRNQTHFYTISKYERDKVISDYPDDVWSYDLVAFDAYTENFAEVNPVYRFWSDANQRHFYTISEYERDQVINNYSDNIWRYEKVAFYTYPDNASDRKPVYRFWSNQKQTHLYTASKYERDLVIASYPADVWGYEGIAYYVDK
jgi:hypothetical protein